MRVDLQRKNDRFHYEATNEQNVTVQIDGAPDIGGADLGARPMQLLLMGLGGCAAIDIGLILQKQKLVIDDVRMTINADRQKDATPSLFEKIHVDIFIDGDLPAAKVKRAVDLSLTKYCSVSKTLEQTADITYTIHLNKQQI